MPAAPDTGRNRSLRYDRNARQLRLTNNKKTLYHSTSVEAAVMITQGKKKGKYNTSSLEIYYEI